MLTSTLRESADAVRATADDAATLVEEIRAMARTGSDEVAAALPVMVQDVSDTLTAVRRAAFAAESAAEEIRANVTAVGMLAGILLSYLLVRAAWSDWRS